MAGAYASSGGMSGGSCLLAKKGLLGAREGRVVDHMVGECVCAW